MKRFGYFLILIITFSCASKKSIFMLQDLSDKDVINYEFEDYKIQKDDILKIEVKTNDLRTRIGTENNFNQFQNTTRESLIYDGYMVNSNGFIDFHGLGKIYVKGLTVNEIKSEIFRLLTDGKILTNPIVDIKILNSHFTILGEVNQPGRYNFLNNDIDIFQAIGMAGDLTINGLRNDIKIIRNSDGKKMVSSIDLTNSDFINDGFFQIFSGDIIIVNPNSSRVKNAGIIDNSGSFLSLVSILISTIILFTNSN